MIFKKVTTFFCGCLLVIFLVSCATQIQEHSKISGHIKMPEKLSQAWSSVNNTLHFTPETIFEHIDGEAEIYFPYGFKSAQSRTYSDGKNVIIADIYLMGSPLDAFGIFSNYRATNSEDLSIGAGGFHDPYQIMFYKGPYFVRITAVGNPEECSNALFECAHILDKLLTSEKNIPHELNWFANKKVELATLRYSARSVLGYPFFKKGFLVHTQKPHDNMRIIVLPHDSEEEAKNTLQEYYAFLNKIGEKPSFLNDELSSHDPMFQNVYFIRFGKFIVGVIGLSDRKQGEEIANEFSFLGHEN